MKQLYRINEKLDFLDMAEEQSSKMSLKELFQYFSILSQDVDSEIRNRTAQVLALYPTKEAEGLLYRMLDDEDFLVRANACDSIFFSSSNEVLKRLQSMAVTDRYLVRGYAILSINDISINRHQQKSQKGYFEKRLRFEKSPWVRVCILRVLCEENGNQYYPLFLQSYRHNNYQIRLLVLNMLCEICNHQRLEDTLEVLTDYLSKEGNALVKSKLQSVIAELSLNKATK